MCSTPSGAGAAQLRQRLAELEAERLRPQPREITPGQRAREALGELLHLIVSECLWSDHRGRDRLGYRQFFNHGDEGSWPGHQSGGQAT